MDKDSNVIVIRPATPPAPDAPPVGDYPDPQEEGDFPQLPALRDVAIAIAEHLAGHFPKTAIRVWLEGGDPHAPPAIRIENLTTEEEAAECRVIAERLAGRHEGWTVATLTRLGPAPFG